MRDVRSFVRIYKSNLNAVGTSGFLRLHFFLNQNHYYFWEQNGGKS